MPDPALERGALGSRAPNGGVEDGPAQWRRAIAEALPMLSLFDADARPSCRADAARSCAPRRYGLVTACDGGLLEVSGLSVPVGALCRVAHGRDGRRCPPK